MLTLLTLAACGPSPTEGEPPSSGSIRAGLDLDIVDFGYVAAGETAEASLLLTSGGSAALTIDEVTTSNPAFTVEDTAPRTLEPGESTTLTVHFAPTASIAYAGTLDVVSDARMPLTAQLLGTADESPECIGTACCSASAPSASRTRTSSSRPSSSSPQISRSQRPDLQDRGSPLPSPEERREPRVSSPAQYTSGPVTRSVRPSTTRNSANTPSLSSSQSARASTV